mmetsp:Transcript_37053/g.52339  ORF Transcript_37053/g.52339 Transcript_37053/m.52339 type:complete len:222 (-) Transcript_37053:1282-1947(-)
MPFANTDKLIMAHLQDISHTLANPSTGTPIGALQGSYTKELQTITETLTNIVNESPMAPTAPIIIQNQTAPAQPHNIIPLEEHTQPTDPATVLRVLEEPPPTNTMTFENSTGLAAQNRHRLKRTILPPKNKKSIRNNPTRQPSTQQIHQAAHLNANFLHHALHRNAFNPDTQQLAEYPELTKCSKGSLWIDSCKDEFGKLDCNRIPTRKGQPTPYPIHRWR